MPRCSRDRRGGVGVLQLGVAILAFVTPARAVIYEVDRTDDTAAATLCTPDPNDCSLRGAFIAANARAGADTIRLPAGGYWLTATGTDEDAAVTGDLDAVDTSGELTLTGAGADTTIIDGNHSDRVLHVFAGVAAKVSGVTLQSGGSGDGGGILNLGEATLSNITLTRNVATDGGGILNLGTATFFNSTVSENSAISAAESLWLVLAR